MLRQIRKLGLSVASISISLVLASCSPIVDTRGHTHEAEDLKQIVVGQSKQEDVMALLGSPTSKSSYGDETWYYITVKKETSGMLAPEVTEQAVTAIRFDKSNAVADIAEYKKEEGKPVELVSQTTPSEGHSVTFLEQMLGNFGRFNAPGRSISSRDLGH